MKNLFVTTEIAQQLKELGYDEQCLAYYEWDFGIRDKKFTTIKEIEDDTKIPITGQYSLFTFFIESGFFRGATCGINSKLSEFTFGDEKRPQYIACPMYTQVVDWFREKHKVYVGVQLTGNSFKQEYLPYTINKLNPNNTLYFNPCKDYYEALTKSIEEALTLIS